MAQPTKYNPLANFQADEAANIGGRSTVRTGAVDTELANIASSVNKIIDNLALIQRDDTQLKDSIVAISSLSATVLALMGGWTPRGQWAGLTMYAVKDLVEVSGVAYVCAVVHTSSAVFATDKPLYWAQISLTAITAASVSFAASGGLSAIDVQAAIIELDAELRVGNNLSRWANYGGF